MNKILHSHGVSNACTPQKARCKVTVGSIGAKKKKKRTKKLKKKNLKRYVARGSTTGGFVCAVGAARRWQSLRPQQFSNINNLYITQNTFLFTMEYSIVIYN